MGVYDMLPGGSQVKCWDSEMVVKRVGDIVDANASGLEYVVLLQEGGFVWVKDGVITEIVEDENPRYPEEFSPTRCIDKWGEEVRSSRDLEGMGMFGYHYYFSHKEGE